ncbi:MAG: hypothetical protein H7175_22615 [Burkholderiales bacterium]|nr:hypothetical protein [Anaerolineae bacterium]
MTDDQAVRPRPVWLKGCAVGIGLLVLLLVAGVFFSFIAPRIANHAEVRANEAFWQRNGVQNYALTVRAVGAPDVVLKVDEEVTLLVRAGEVVEIRSAATLSEFRLGAYRPYTIDELFRRAYDCVFSCSVVYHDIYGFPVRIGGLERGWIEVTDFEPHP